MKFSICDLLLVIVAVCAAWWVDRSKLANKLNKQKSPYQYPTYSNQTPVLQWKDGAWNVHPRAPAPNPPKP
jgi:hypothetical protein